MKWTNKGHQFDEIGMRFKKCKTLYIYGASEAAKFVIEMIEFAISSSNNGVIDVNIVLVDKNPQKQATKMFGKDVISPEEFYASFENEVGIVVMCISNFSSVTKVFGQMESHGIKRREQSFEGFYEFSRYLSLFIYYRYNKLFIHFLDTFAHTNCNLKCKHCCVQTNMGVRKSLSEEALKNNIDLFFSKVDTVGVVVFGIAEGFLGGKVSQTGIKYICNKYSDRFLWIEIVTNGTVKPSPELIEILKLPKIRVVLDDYRENVEIAKQTFPDVMKILEQNNITYSSLKRTFWYDSGFNKTDYSDLSESELSKKHFECIWHAKGFPFQGYNTDNGSLIYNCSFQAINTYLNLFEEAPNDSLNMETASPIEIIEFILGYTENGYLSACKRCNGMFEGVELTHIPVAEQI